MLEKEKKYYGKSLSSRKVIKKKRKRIVFRKILNNFLKKIKKSLRKYIC